MTTTALIVLSTIIVGVVLLMPGVAKNILWRATITPLASIIGSGFLILGPILDHAYGGYAPLVMAALCMVAYLFGSVMRANIRSHDTVKTNNSIMRLENVSSWVLAFAYIISVAYYLNLFGAFGVRLAGLQDATSARLLTSAVFVVILLVGSTQGFSALEKMEQLTVTLKLAIIAGLLVGLTLFNGEIALNTQLVFNPARIEGWPALTLAFGLIVTIQGFETSRYLGDEYDTQTRIRSMRLAQFISTAIYVAYISLIAYVFKPEDFSLSETAIIDMMGVVAPVLPALLIAAALSAQFSAAVADTGGSGGLISELTKNRINPSQAYVVLVVAGLILTWSINIFEIVSYASRAFAIYYGLQAAIAALLAAKTKNNALNMKTISYSALAILGLAIAMFGTPVET